MVPHSLPVLLNLISLLSQTSLASLEDGYGREENQFGEGYDGWILPEESWLRIQFKSLMTEYPDLIQILNTTNQTKQEVEENYVLIPNLKESTLSTMTRDLSLPNGGELEVAFEVLLTDWDRNAETSESNPKLQVFYDEDVVFDLQEAVSTHKDHYVLNRWNQFKLVSEYREGINITITVVGSRFFTNSTNVPVVLDNFIITSSKSKQSTGAEGEEEAGRLEPKAELNENGTWTFIQTEALKEAKSEAEERGQPFFCSLLPDSASCGRFPKKRYFYNATSSECEVFLHMGCKGNENQFDDRETCQLICADRKPALIDDIGALRKSVFTTFDLGFQDWSSRNWRKLKYGSEAAEKLEVKAPPVLDPNFKNNELGVCPEYHSMDFRNPTLRQEFAVEKNSMLRIEFQLLVKGKANSALSGLFSLFLRLDPGFEVYVGDVKVFDFSINGVFDERWHEYEIMMNQTEVEAHRINKDEDFILITLKGWLGNGESGIVVLDNLNVTQTRVEGAEQAVNIHPVELDNGVPMTSGTESTSTTTLPEACSLKKDPGSCTGSFIRYYFDANLKECIQFLWTGCTGNANRYGSVADCLSDCSGNFSTLQPLISQSDEENGVTQIRTGSSILPPQTDILPPPPQVDVLPATGANLVQESPVVTISPNIQIAATAVGTTPLLDLTGRQSAPAPLAIQPAIDVVRSSGSVLQNSQTTILRPGVGGFNESECGEPADTGTTCTNGNQKMLYYYSPLFENCFKFLYSGCGGNGNKFLSWRECWIACQPQEEDGRSGEMSKFSNTGSSSASTTPSARPTTTADMMMEDVRQKEDASEEEDTFSSMPYIVAKDHTPDRVCSQDFDPGPCAPRDPAKFKTRYYFDITSDACEKFLYGGCGGNHNNFINKTDCESFCIPEEEKPVNATTEDGSSEKMHFIFVHPFNRSSCFESPRHGTCNGQLPRWYYSRWDNVCKAYNYTGCNANRNSFVSKDDCDSFCPPVEIYGNEKRCDKLRNRGNCEAGEIRFFYDKFSERCIRFVACGDVSDNENNFDTKQECRQTCRPPREQGNLTIAEVKIAEPLVDSDSSVTAATVFEVLLSILLVGLCVFAAVLGYRHYRARQSAETYRQFQNDVQSQGMDNCSTATPNSLSTFNNPLYTQDLYCNVLGEEDRHVQIPPLTLGHLGVIQEHSQEEHEGSFA